MPRISQSQVTYTAADGVTFAFTVDVGTVAGRAVALVVGLTNSGNSVVSATIDGVAANISSIVNDLSKNAHGIYRDNITGTGLVTVSVTLANTTGLARYGYVGYNGIGSVRTPVAAMTKASNTAPTATVTTVANDVVVMLGWEGDYGVTFTAASPATMVLGGAVIFGAEEVATTTSTVIDGSLSGSAPWAAFAIAMVPSGVAATTMAADGSSSSTGSGQFAPEITLAGDGRAAMTGAGKFAVPQLKTKVLSNNSGAAIVSTLIDKVAYVKLSDLQWAPVTTNALGEIVIASESFVVGDGYVVVTSNTAGSNTGASTVVAT